MQTERRGRLAAWGGALLLALSPGLCLAQDGQQKIGPPVTEPRTNNNLINSAQPITDTPPRQTTNDLPAVPATPSDPAPPGTRGVPADRLTTGANPAPGTAPAPGTTQIPGTTQAPATGRVEPLAGSDMAPGTQLVEGVVTRISKPGTNLPEERLHLTVDATQDWATYATQGPTGLPSRSEAKSEPTAPPAGQDRGGIDLAVTRRSFIFAVARDRSGRNLPGVDTPSSPLPETSRSGDTTRPVVRTAEPKVASFTNIREGSFVSVQYRKVGDVNEAVRVNLIEMPTLSTPSEVAPTGDTSASIPGTLPGRAGTTTGTASPARNGVDPGAGAAAGTPGSTLPSTGAAANPATGAGRPADVPSPTTRVPSVPVNPTAPPSPR